MVVRALHVVTFLSLFMLSAASATGRELRMDDDLSFESWEAVEDVYEEMLGEEYEVEKLRKAKARTRLNARRDPELTLDTAEKEDTTSEGELRGDADVYGDDPDLEASDFDSEDDSIDPGHVQGVDYETPPKEEDAFGDEAYYR